VLVARSIRIQGTEDVDRYNRTGSGWDDYNHQFRTAHH
jgi:hypothetical protein